MPWFLPPLGIISQFKLSPEAHANRASILDWEINPPHIPIGCRESKLRTKTPFICRTTTGVSNVLHNMFSIVYLTGIVTPHGVLHVGGGHAHSYVRIRTPFRLFIPPFVRFAPRHSCVILLIISPASLHAFVQPTSAFAIHIPLDRMPSRALCPHPSPFECTNEPSWFVRTTQAPQGVFAARSLRRVTVHVRQIPQL